VKNIARNAKQTEFQNDGELAFVRTFLKVIWNPMTQSGTRPWLKEVFQRKAVQVPTNTDYVCDIDKQPVHVLVVLMEIVGRDFKKLPITNVEKLGADILFGVSHNRRLGTTPYFGSVGGSVVSIP
jgi:hypothetical protein